MTDVEKQSLKIGDTLICLHKTGELDIADTVTIDGQCSGCGGFTFVGYHGHYQVEHFDLFGAPVPVREDADKIDTQKVLNVFNDLAKVIMMNVDNEGYLPSGTVIRAIRHNLEILKLWDRYRMPTNRPEN